MKKIIIVLALLVILGAAAYLVLLNKPGIVLTGDRITKYIDNINKNNKDFHISLSKNNVKIKKTGSGVSPEFKVTLKDIKFKYTLKGLIKSMKIPEIDYSEIPDVDIIEKAAEINLIVNPVKSYVAMLNTNNLQIKLIDKENIFDFNCNIERINGNKLDISPIFFSDNKTFQAIYSKMILLNPKYDVSFKNFKGTAVDKENKDPKVHQIDFKIKNVRFQNDTAKDLLKAIYAKDFNIDVKKLVKKKINSVNFLMNDLLIEAFDKSKKKVGQLNLSSINMNSLIKPGEKENTLSFDFNYILKNCKFKSFGKPNDDIIKAAAIITFNEINLNISLKSLSSDVLDLYLKISKELIEKYDNDPEMAAELFKEKSEDFKNAFYSTEPVLSINLKPFDHLIGKFELTSSFKFIKNAMFPVGKAKSIIYNLEQIKRNMLKYKLATKEDLNKKFQFINKYYKKQGADYVAEFEIKDKPPFFMLNGEPLKR